MNGLNKFHPTSQMAIYLAIISFGVSSMLSLFYILFSIENLFLLGVGLFLIAFILNSIAAIVVLGSLLSGKTPIKQGLLTLYIQLLNIPVTIFYLFLISFAS